MYKYFTIEESSIITLPKIRPIYKILLFLFCPYLMSVSIKKALKKKDIYWFVWSWMLSKLSKRFY